MYATTIDNVELAYTQVIAVCTNTRPNFQSMQVLARHEERMEGQAEFALNYVAPEKKGRK